MRCSNFAARDGYEVAGRDEASRDDSGRWTLALMFGPDRGRKAVCHGREQEPRRGRWKRVSLISMAAVRPCENQFTVHLLGMNGAASGSPTNTPCPGHATLFQ